MSFSADVKNELYQVLPNKAHCAGAEVCGIFAVLQGKAGSTELVRQPESGTLSRKIFTLLKKADKIESGRPPEKECCRRAFLRGAFLAGGSISDPRGDYHLEFACRDATSADLLLSVLAAEGISAKRSVHKGSPRVYLKDGDQIVTVLGKMGAGKALMHLENARIVRDVRGNVNRRVNCETANLQKTVKTALRQAEDIRMIEQSVGLGALPENLRVVAKLRLANPEASLKELGEMLHPPLKKSGINHRLEKIRDYARALEAAGQGAKAPEEDEK